MSVGKDASSAKPGGLDGKCKNMLEKLCGKYDNLSEVSKMHEVLQKVETVKLTMQDNIEQALLNCTALEDVEGKAARLQEDSKVFKQVKITLSIAPPTAPSMTRLRYTRGLSVSAADS